MDAESRYAELDSMLRPAGGGVHVGVHVVSTGVREQRALQRAARDEDVSVRWCEALRRVPDARVAVLGVPSDAGAGFTRGANRAPEPLRRALMARPEHPFHDPRVVDVGDVRVVPQLLSDDMLSPAQLAATRKALYGEDPRFAHLPVSPLDVCARALAHVTALGPEELFRDSPSSAALSRRSRRSRALGVGAVAALVTKRSGPTPLLAIGAAASFAESTLRRRLRVLPDGRGAPGEQALTDRHRFWLRAGRADVDGAPVRKPSLDAPAIGPRLHARSTPAPRTHCEARFTRDKDILDRLEHDALHR